MQVQFGKPTIGAKEYVSTTNTGWPEVFNREAANEAVRLFLHPIPLQDALDNFLEGFRLRRAERGRGAEILWGDVSSYLQRVRGLQEHDDLPGNVAVGFWALVLLEFEALKNQDAN